MNPTTTQLKAVALAALVTGALAGCGGSTTVSATHLTAKLQTTGQVTSPQRSSIGQSFVYQAAHQQNPADEVMVGVYASADRARQLAQQGLAHNAAADIPPFAFKRFGNVVVWWYPGTPMFADAICAVADGQAATKS